ncbi:MAG: hypothetical protein COC17_00300 [Hyphomicrobiales bacterium]|nr:DUF995 domain-containing protein [Hyphomicrobiales bacterium]PCH51570.1 MAG: hypothetical protein COC17_00300 [Hyphomicrobiales bacterium]
MYKSTNKPLAIILVTSAMIFASPTASLSDYVNNVDGAKNLTRQELHGIYDGRSWMWNDGGGYFRVSKREFTAWVGREEKSSIAKGIWFLPGGGKACFNAIWTAVEWKVVKLTCFAHKTDGKHVYQRKLPDGDWYVFKHTPVRYSDEFGKLKQADLISLNYARNYRYIKSRRLENSCRSKQSFSEFLTCIFKR